MAIDIDETLPPVRQTPLTTGPRVLSPRDAGTSAIPGGTYLGTDTFIGSAATDSKAGATENPVAGDVDGEVSLNFIDTDLREVIKAVISDILGANYVLDPRVQGTVTLQTSKPVSRSSLIFTLEQVLAVNGAALIRLDNLYKIVPADQSVRGSLLSRGDFEKLRSPGTGLAVVPLRYISAGEMQNILQDFAAAGVILRADRVRNLLVVGGNENQRANVMELVDIFDVNWLEGMSFALVPIQSTNAEALVEELEGVFGDQAEGPLAGIIRFVPLQRMNAILAVSSRSSYIQQAETWIQRLDVGEEATQRVYVYYCQNTRAEEIAEVLNQIFGDDVSTVPSAGLAPGLSPVRLEGSRGRSRFGGTSRSRTPQSPSPLQALSTQIDPQLSLQAEIPPPPGLLGAGGNSAGNNEVDAKESLRSTEGVSLDGTPLVRIIPDPLKNALVILATPNDYRRVEAALKKLDIQSLQVLIEATFVEVALTDDLEFGTQWSFDFGANEIFFPSAQASSTAGFFNWAVVTQGGSLSVALRALQERTEVNVLSSPNLMVLDNQQARIQIGDQVPIRTRTSQSVDNSNAPVVSSIEYRDTGTILNVTPRVNESGLVTIELDQEVSDVAETASSDIDSPTITQRSIQSTIAVHDGESIVLGGLIGEDKDKSRAGLPFLSQIPVLGALFGTHRDASVKRELIVVITPRVVRDQSEARQVTDEVSRRMQRLRPSMREFNLKDASSAR